MNFEESFAHAIYEGDLQAIKSLEVDHDSAEEIFTCNLEIPKNDGNSFSLPIIRRPTPLIYAICCHQIDIVKYLATLKVDFTSPLYSWHPIHYAVALRDISIVSFILSIVPNEISAETSDHCATPLDIAVSSGILQLVILLLNKGAPVDHQNSSGQTALHLSTVLPNAEIAKCLLSYGAPFSTKNMKNQTPLDIALSRNNKIVSNFLEEASSNPKIIPNQQQYISGFYQPQNQDNIQDEVHVSDLNQKIDILSQRISAIEENLEQKD